MTQRNPTAPQIVALVRGIIIAGVVAGGGAIVKAASSTDWSTLGKWSPVAIVIVRLLEGVVLDAGRGAPPQEGALGGRDATHDL